MEPKIFVSHTRRDKEVFDRLDNIIASIGLPRFRSEYETITKPEWMVIKNEINESIALFLIVGKELLKCMEGYFSNSDDKFSWKFTQNWISYEIGIACQKGIDVWVICDDLEINFPVPYLNNYTIFGPHPENEERREWFKSIFNNYKNWSKYPVKKWEFAFSCPNCASTYNQYSSIPPKNQGGRLVCPTCLNYIEFDKGWLWENLNRW
jgi:hypothetical protein